jgi:EmrB/QacA subfamily drug resistance transporter
MRMITNRSVSSSGNETSASAAEAPDAAQTAGAAARAAEFSWTRRHVLALAVLCLAALLDTIDVTVVNVAMPAIRNSLHFSEGGLAWMVDAYMVPFGGFLLLGGRTGDLLGRRRVLLAGTAVFSLASLGSAVAPNAGVMIVTRAAEGIAAAFVAPMTLAMLSSVFPAGPARNRAFAVWGSVSAAAGTLGLVLGGVLVSAAGWRWIFLINVPVGVLVAASALRVLPADVQGRRGQAELRAGSRASGSGLRGFDLGGAVSVTAGASLLAYGVAQTSSQPWGSARTIGLLCGAVALIGYFVFHEARVAASPLMPLSLWRNRSVTGANVVSALLASAMFAVFYSTTLYMQQVLHYSALRTGLAYVPFGLSILVAAGIAPGLVTAAGIRVTSIAGSAVSLAGLVLLAGIPASGHLLTDIILPTVAVGLGAGIVIVPTSVAAMSGVTPDRHGVASALLNVSRQLGGALGLAVISAVVASSTARSAAAGHSVPTALTAGFHAGFTLSAALVAVTIVIAAALLREDGRGQRVNLIELQAGR